MTGLEIVLYGTFLVPYHNKPFPGARLYLYIKARSTAATTRR